MTDTDKTKLRLRLEATAIAVIFGAGSGFGTFYAKYSALETKIDTKFEQLHEELVPLKNDVTGIKNRVSAMYCAQVPVANRPGCE